MRLLVDAHVFDEAPQGTQTYIKGIYTEIISLHDPNIEIFFCAINVANLRAEFGDHPNVTYLKLRSRSSAVRLAFEFPYLINRYGIDIAHFQYITPLIKTCMEIVTIHDVLFLDHPEYFPARYKFHRPFLFRRSARRADLVLTVSEYSRSAISLHFMIPPEKIHITPNAVSQEFFEPLNLDGKIALKSRYHLKKFLLYVSRIEPRKNQITLLRAFHELELWKKGYDLVFIGRTDIAASEFLGYLMGLSGSTREHIKVLDNIPLDDLNMFYKSCEIFVYPSLAEGFGIPPLEAAASLASVLCSNVTAMKDFGFFGEMFFDPMNLHELKKKITHSLENRDEQKIGEIQQHVRLKYSWKTAAATLRQKLRELAGE